MQLPREDVKNSLTALRSKYFAYLEIKAKKMVDPDGLEPPTRRL